MSDLKDYRKSLVATVFPYDYQPIKAEKLSKVNVKMFKLMIFAVTGVTAVSFNKLKSVVVTLCLYGALRFGILNRIYRLAAVLQALKVNPVEPHGFTMNADGMGAFALAVPR